MKKTENNKINGEVRKRLGTRECYFLEGNRVVGSTPDYHRPIPHTGLEQDRGQVVMNGDPLLADVNTTDVMPPWISLMSSPADPLTHSVTIGLVRAYRNDDSKRALNHIVMRTNRQLFKRSGVKRGYGLTGFAISEPNDKSLDKYGCVHFHLIVRSNHGLLDTEHLRTALDIAIEKTVDSFGRKVSVPGVTDVTPMYDSIGLARYLTKTFNRPAWAQGAGVSFITPKGIVGDVLEDKQWGQMLAPF